MSTERWMRASDQDRERATEVLRDAYAVGRLNRDEFDERTVAAYSARTQGELHDLTVDLPAPPAGALPSDIVTGRDVMRHSSHRTCAQMIWTFVLVLAAALAGRVFPGAVWIATLASIGLVFAATRRAAGDRPHSRP